MVILVTPPILLFPVIFITGNRRMGGVGLIKAIIECPRDVIPPQRGCISYLQVLPGLDDLIVTNSSANVGWMPMVLSKSALVAPQFIATANP